MNRTLALLFPVSRLITKMINLMINSLSLFKFHFKVSSLFSGRRRQTAIDLEMLAKSFAYVV